MHNQPHSKWLLFMVLAAGCADTSETNDVTCEVNQHVILNNCQPCPAGTLNEPGDPAAGEDTICTPTLCGDNEHVVDHRCTPCAQGATNPAGNNASGRDTMCNPTICGPNEQVTAHQCTPCPVGTSNQAGDQATDPDTACDPVFCADHQRVVDNTCRDCAAGSTNEAGDDAAGDETRCDPCPAGTFDEGGHNCVPCSGGSISEAGQTECTPCSAGTFALDNACADCPSDLVSSEGASACHVIPADSLLSARDYGYLFWPTNHWHRWRQYLNIQHVQTGYYGLTFDVG